MEQSFNFYVSNADNGRFGPAEVGKMIVLNAVVWGVPAEFLAYRLTGSYQIDGQALETDCRPGAKESV